MKIYRLSSDYGAPSIFNPDVDEMGHIEMADLRGRGRWVAVPCRKNDIPAVIMQALQNDPIGRANLKGKFRLWDLS